MAEKLSTKSLSGELDSLRIKMQELESGLENKLESSLEKASGELKAKLDALQSDSGQGSTAEPSIDTETRRQLIAETAYLRAERRGFSGGSPEQDWLEAEREINNLLLLRLTQRESQEKAETDKAG
jgi:hypothetical protein